MKENFNEQRVSKQIRMIQEQEKLHLEVRVQINDKLVKMNQLHYELQKQKFIIKSGIEDCEIEAQMWPFIHEINDLRIKESAIMEEINELVEELRIVCYYPEEEY